MHSLNHSTLANATAAEHWSRVVASTSRSTRRHPPPVRALAAALTARVAVRLDREAARRALA